MAKEKDNSTTKKVTKKVVKKVAVKKEKTVKEKKPKAEKVQRTKKKVRNESTETKILKHTLIPLHEKITDKEAKEIFEYHNITMKELPKILKNDPAIRHLEPKENDVIKITRNSPTAGKSIFYRGVINE